MASLLPKRYPGQEQHGTIVPMSRRFIFGTIGLLVLLAAAAVWTSHYFSPSARNTLPPAYYRERPSASTANIQVDHIVVIVMENKSRSEIIGSDDAPYINSLAAAYAQAANYYAVAHPSLPNYIALTSATTAGITGDCSPPGRGCQANAANIADSLEKAGKTWKAYMESMPTPCALANSRDYAVRHNPFVYYPDIRNGSSRCNAHDVPFSRLTHDLAGADTFPAYAFVTPNLCNDMHNCSAATGDRWLAAHIPAILRSPAFTAQRSLLVITWDESESGNSNNVPVIFAGSAAKRKYVSRRYVSHYSLLHTIETIWRLRALTNNDASAPLMTDMLQ